MKGFTILELILSMTLMGILLAASGVLLGRGLDAYNLVSAHSDSVEQARYAMIRMEKEIETVTNISNSQVTQFGFTDTLGAATDFHLNGTDLMRGNDPLARNVTSLAFTYYKSDGSATNANPQVRRVQIDLTVQATGGAGTVHLRSEVFPRNFYYDTFQ